MSSLNEIKAERKKKRNQLLEAGLEVYPSETNRTHTLTSVITSFAEISDSESTVVVAGRVLSLRKHGGSIFADLTDGTEVMQLFFSRDTMGTEAFSLLMDTIDAGDFIEVTGTCYTTKRAVQSIAVRKWNILTKSLQAIPTSHFGIKDEDERYRKRYLDLLLNPAQRDLFVKKARFWQIVRNFMQGHGFLEVETPTLEVTTGGAEARPFQTHHHDYDMDVYLRISVGELWQKHLMAAGFPKTFEIGRVYRNEGTSPEHLQEFTNMEFYWAYANYCDGMRLVTELYRTIATELYGTTKFKVRDHNFDLADEWQEIDYVDEIEAQTGLNILSADIVSIQKKLENLGVQYEGETRERLVDSLWKYCRKQISGPAFLVNHPILVAPLAKRRPGTDTVEMFQPIIAGSEVGRGYSELNDPEEQRERFLIQQELLVSGDEEAMMPDWDFVDMLEYGMPPTCGFGFGERLFAFLEGKTLRETQLFPLMRPKNK